MNSLQLFVEVFIIVIWGGPYRKLRPINRIFNLQGTIITLPCQGIFLIVVHYSFLGNIIIWVKVLCIIILVVLFIGRVCFWCFCGTCRGFSLVSNLLTNLHDLFNKLLKSVVINFSVNYCLGNCCRFNVQEYNQNSQNSLTGQTWLHLTHDMQSALLWILRTFTEMSRTPRQLEVFVSGCWFRALAVYQDLKIVFAQ